jgi:hypothetical protein
MKDVTDAFDSLLIGQTRAKVWENEFLANWFKPLTDMMINAGLNIIRNSPMIDREKLEQRLSPEAIRKLRGE